MQDAIILYENGKAIGGEGHPTDADDITFDNSNTDLVSENVEGAIKEVNIKASKSYVSVIDNETISLSNVNTELLTFPESGTYIIFFGFIGATSGLGNVYLSTHAGQSPLRDCGTMGQSCFVETVSQGDKLYGYCSSSTLPASLARTYLGYIKL